MPTMTASKPIIKKPAAQKPAVQKPVAQKPAAQKPVAEAPTVLKAAVKAPAAKPTPKPAVKPAPRIAAETPATYFAGNGGRAWRMSGKHAVAYVHTATLAGELLATEPRQVGQSAMAVYYDRKGRPFAWQFRFDTTRWEEVVRRLG